MSSPIQASNLKLKRAYLPPEHDDGTRVLVDRLWPRGVTKLNAAIDIWAKALAPSTELRQWFGHEPERWIEFRRRYIEEIKDHTDELERLRALVQQGMVTLVYAAHDEIHNDAVVLRDLLLKQG